MKEAITICLLFFLNHATSAQSQFWLQTNGPWGYACYAVAFDSTGNVFASDGNAYRSTDNGNSWKHLAAPQGFVLGFMADQNGNVYAGTANAGIFKSTNGGTTWAQVNNGLTSLDIRSLVVRPQGDLFADTRGGGVFYSSNGGLLWLNRSAGLPNSIIGAPSLAVDSYGTLYATTDSSGIFKSTNAGLNWNSSSNGLTNRWTNVVVADPNNILYVATQGGVYRSTDLGESWTQVNAGLSSTLVWALTTNRSGHVFCGLLNAEVYRSTTHGDTWELMGAFGTAYSTFLAVNNFGHVFLANLKGLFRSSDNGAQWTQCGLPNSNILAIDAHHNGRIYACVDNDVPFFTTNAGATWIRSSAPGYAVSAFTINSRDMIFAASSYLDRSTDGGNTWERVGAGLPGVRILTLTSNLQDVLYVGHETIISPPGYAGGGVYRSADDGTTWTLIGFDRTRVQSLTVSSSGDVYAVIYPGGLHRTTDDGLTWTPLPQLTSSTQSILSIGRDTLLAGTFGNGVYRSTDKGATWSHVVQSEITVNSFAYHSEGKVLAAADTNGVLLSTDNGLTWATVVSGLERIKVNCITFDPYGYAHVGTMGGGVFASSDRVTSVQGGNQGLIESYFLDQNYPNPWNPSTTIRYSLPHDSFVSLTVFNVLGQRVTQLVNGPQQAGNHKVVLNGGKLSSGVYFYRLETKDYTHTRQMLLLR